MPNTVKPATWLAIGFICLTGAAAIAWQNKPAPVTTRATVTDTVPKREKKQRDKINDNETIINGDLDKAIQDLEKAKAELDAQFKKQDWQKMKQEVQQSLQKLDAEKIEQQIEQAMKSVDMQKIQLQTQEAMKKINLEKMSQELSKLKEEHLEDVARALKNVDLKKMQADAQQSLEKVDMEKIQLELKKAHEQMSQDMEKSKLDMQKAIEELKAIDMEKMQKDLQKEMAHLQFDKAKMKAEMDQAKKQMQEAMKKDWKQNWKQELEKANEGIERAKEELLNYKNMVDEMNKDGLINKDGGYEIEYNNGDLLINGKKQSDETVNKYRHYFKKDKFKLKKNKDSDNKKSIDL